MPKLKQDHEISLQAESDDLDEVMAQNGVTEDQLANSHKPKVTGALESKNQAPNEAAAAPKRYRNQENTLLKRARNYPAKPGKAKLIAMYGARAKVLLKIFGDQIATEKQGETQQEKVHKLFAVNYNSTKKAVTEKLDALSENMDVYFE
ncbi:MAG: hypothetical protein AAF998_17785 [Bacteroidota bacterium]